MHNSAIRSRVASPKWCAWLDSNEHWTRSQRVPSAIGVQARGGPGRIRTCDGHCQRIKSPPRSAATVTGPWMTWRTRVVRSTGPRVKSPLPLHSGLRLRVRIGANGRYCPSYHAVIGRGPHFSDSLAWLLFEWCSLTDSNRRMSGRRPDAFAAWRREPELVRRAGLEPATCRS